MAPISAESNVCCGLDPLETITDMAGLRLSEQHFRKSPALTGESPHHRADEPIRNCDAITMLALSLNYQHRVREWRGAPQYPDLGLPSLIGRLGSSAFRLSAITVTMSLAGSCLSYDHFAKRTSMI